MAKVGKETAIKTFALDPSVEPGDRNSTGLIWRVQNQHSGAKTKPGDKVYFGERWQRGSIPYATIRRILKEHARQMAKVVANPPARVSAEEIARMRKESAPYEKQRAIEKIKRQFITDGEDVIWRDNFRNAVGGSTLKSPITMINGRVFSKGQIVSILCGDDFELPERSTPQEFSDMKAELRYQSRTAARLTKDKKNRDDYLEYRGSQMRGETEITPATQHEMTEAYLYDARHDIAILKKQVEMLMTLIPAAGNNQE